MRSSRADPGFHLPQRCSRSLGNIADEQAISDFTGIARTEQIDRGARPLRAVVAKIEFVISGISDRCPRLSIEIAAAQGNEYES
jgi:hypothetical protein